MLGYRFYLEFPSPQAKRKGVKANNYQGHSGNIIAVYLPTQVEQYMINRCYECFSATFYRENSPVSWGCVSPDYLQENCKRVPEQIARKIHPRLFERLT